MSVNQVRFFASDMSEEHFNKHIKNMNFPKGDKIVRIDTSWGTLPVDDKNPDGDTFKTVLVQFEMKNFTEYGVEYLKAMESCIDALADDLERGLLVWEVHFEDGDWGNTTVTRKEVYRFLTSIRVFLTDEYKIADSIGMGDEYVRKNSNYGECFKRKK
tara:strand:+ start:2882 stop:3355 length:474 start_codon:yes stop_codon:yes gene_type:complete